MSGYIDKGVFNCEKVIKKCLREPQKTKKEKREKSYAQHSIENRDVQPGKQLLTSVGHQKEAEKRCNNRSSLEPSARSDIAMDDDVCSENH